MKIKPIDMNSYYRAGVFRHFTEDSKCSVSITNRIDVSDLVAASKRSGTPFYVNFIYVLSRVLNSREDYRMTYDYRTNQLGVFDKINPAHYIFHEDTGTCTVVYTEFDDDYAVFRARCEQDIAAAKQTREYGLDAAGHPNWFDASYISWISYDSLNIELPDGYVYLTPIVNWGRYAEENGRLMMPVSVRMNHASADGYLIAQVFLKLAAEMTRLCEMLG